jgi:pimeloyl-ACP methyl ester carboxylesterase
MRDYSPGALLPKITCPVLLLYGEPALGSFVEPEQLQWYRSRVQDLTSVHIPGAGHVLHRPNPILYFQHVMDFLEAL